jgi:hypothetical protein
MLLCEGNIDEYLLLKKSPNKLYLSKLMFWVQKHKEDVKG